MELEIETSRVFTDIINANTRIVVNEGSSRSTKTYSICQAIIAFHLQRKGIRTTIARSRLTWLKASVLVDFLEILDKQFKMFDPDNWNATDKIYKINGGEISFIGLDEAQKVHGRKQDIFWINEAIETEYKDFEQLIIRTTGQAILDYNPSAEQHWIYDKVIPRDDCTFIKSTYKDNPFLSKDIVDEIERLEPTEYNIKQGTADDVSWRIYGLGERAAHKGLIFSKVKICKELPPREEWSRWFYGLDFGFTNDPTCLVLIVLAHGDLYFKQIIYKRGLTNIRNQMNPLQRSIQSEMESAGILKQETIWADPAEPKSIQDLQNCGWGKLNGAEKGPDSIKAGIDTILRYNCFITEDSIDAIKEKNNYKWKESKSGELENTPVDSFNHFWDACRYGCFMELRKTGGGFRAGLIRR